MATNMAYITRKTQWYIDMGGAFSVITKLGRKAEKCLITITNAPKDTTPPQFNSIAWSYQHMYPIQAQIKTQMTTKEPQTEEP
jgi:hypothetical protein